jgi:hypothetical protein
MRGKAVSKWAVTLIGKKIFVSPTLTGVGIATDYGLEGRASNSGRRKNDSGTHTASYPHGVGGSFSRGKAIGA